MDMQGKIDIITRLDLAINRLDGAYYVWARSHRLKENMLTLLYALDDGTPHTQKQICEDWLMPKTTVNTLVKELTEKGYAALENAPGKEKYVSLTETGSAYAKEALAKLYSAEIDAVDSVLGDFSPDFVDAIERYADILCGKLKTRNE